MRPPLALGSSPELFAFTMYVTSSPGRPLPHLLDGHRLGKLVGHSAIPVRSCPAWQGQFGILGEVS